MLSSNLFKICQESLFAHAVMSHAGQINKHYLKVELLKQADHRNTQSVTSCLWRRVVESESVEIMIRGRTRRELRTCHKKQT